MAGMNPALVIGRQSAAGNDCVDMIMGQQVGSPCVQDGEESDLCTEALGSAADFEQGLGTGIEQQVSSGLREVSASGFSSWGRVKTTWK
jgi:hypothetical protein